MAKFVTGLFFGLLLGGYLVSTNPGLLHDIRCLSVNNIGFGDAEICSMGSV